MKKIFSILFSIAFLLVFVSFFSQKSLATCPANQGCYTIGTCPAGTTGGATPCAGDYSCQSCPASTSTGGGSTGGSGGGTTSTDPCTVKHNGVYYYGGVCNADKTILYQCGGTPNHGSGSSTTYQPCNCQVNNGTYDTCASTTTVIGGPPGTCGTLMCPPGSHAQGTCTDNGSNSKITCVSDPAGTVSNECTRKGGVCKTQNTADSRFPCGGQVTQIGSTDCTNSQVCCPPVNSPYNPYCGNPNSPVTAQGTLDHLTYGVPGSACRSSCAANERPISNVSYNGINIASCDGSFLCCQKIPSNGGTCTVSWGSELPSTLTPNTNYTVSINQVATTVVTWHDVSVYIDGSTTKNGGLTQTGNNYSLTFNSGSAGTHTLNFYNNDYMGYNPGGLDTKNLCTPAKTVTTAAPAPTCTTPTYTGWSTCTNTNQNSCSLTGSQTRTKTDCNGVKTNETQACTLSTRPTCQAPNTCQSDVCAPPPATKPVAPVTGTFSCNASTPTTATLPFHWTTEGTNPKVYVYYCNKTFAAAHGVSCTKDSPVSKDTEKWGWYIQAAGDNGHYTDAQGNQRAIAEGLTASDEYTWFVRAANDGGQTDSSPDSTFTAGACGVQPGLALVLGLDGIGTTGDQVNPDWTTKTNTAIINGQSVTNPVAGSNQTPKNPIRPVILTLTAANSTTPITLTGNVTFQPSGANVGKYTGIIPYGANFAAGTYTIKITVNGHLTKLVPGSQAITDIDTTVNVPSVNLVAGDIDGDNSLTSSLSLGDYNILLSCISDSDYKDVDAHALCGQNANYKARADLEDNGAIDKFDYNLFLREFSVKQAGD